MTLHALVQYAVEQGASDLHIQAGAVPMLRITTQLSPMDGGPVSNEQVASFIASLVNLPNDQDLTHAAMQGLDFAYALGDLARFRCSVYCALGRLGIVMRVIRMRIPSVQELNLPAVVSDIAMCHRGLILVSGTTGSGKSTTLAAMIDLINSSQAVKLICIEDPVEYLQPGKQAMVSQLEVGVDTPSFDQALRQALRQNPDVILVGEIRDVETLRMALRAADTGHQVFATVHATRAAQTIERIIAMFPAAEHRLLLSQLAHSVEAIISQRLVLGIDGKSRRPAVEILRGGPVTEKYILEGKLPELTAYVESRQSGMQSFDQDLLRMYQARLVSGTEALRWATRPEALATAMRGVHHIGGAKR